MIRQPYQKTHYHNNHTTKKQQLCWNPVKVNGNCISGNINLHSTNYTYYIHTTHEHQHTTGIPQIFYINLMPIQDALHCSR